MHLFYVLSLKASWANSFPTPQLPKYLTAIIATFLSQNGKKRAQPSHFTDGNTKALQTLSL
jgi:hypothetical protein